MSDSKPTIGQLARAFEIATTHHQKNLTKLKGEALREKIAYAQRYDGLLNNLQTPVDKISALMTAMMPKIRGLQQLEKKSTATKHPVKQPAMKAAHARKEKE